MDIEMMCDYCLAKKEVEEGFPFGETVLVFKVKGKVFLLARLDTPTLEFNVKCDPERAIEWREQFAAAQPGYHMNKSLWNTVTIDGNIYIRIVRGMIDNFYGLVLKYLAKKRQKNFVC